MPPMHDFGTRATASAPPKGPRAGFAAWTEKWDRSAPPRQVAKARGRLLSSRAFLFPPSATPIDLSSIFSIQAIIEPFFALSTSTYARYNPATAALGSRVPSYTHFLRGDDHPIFRLASVPPFIVESDKDLRPRQQPPLLPIVFPFRDLRRTVLRPLPRVKYISRRNKRAFVLAPTPPPPTLPRLSFGLQVRSLLSLPPASNTNSLGLAHVARHMRRDQ